MTDCPMNLIYENYRNTATLREGKKHVEMPGSLNSKDF